jgi:CubicO group peptidase (beta-lactamase class C family)
MYLPLARLSISILALVAMTSSVGATEEDSKQPTTQVREEALQALGEELAGWVANGDPVGAELLVIQYGKKVFHEVYGWSDREEDRPLERNSIYRIRSMTKPLLGTAVLMLVEDGRLALDDSVAKYLPSFDNDRSRVITIRQLLTHTSGLGDHGFGDIGLDRAPHEYQDLRALADAIGQIGPSETQGEFLYSDSGSATLGALVAEVSGVPLERFIEQRILKPLGMNDTRTRFEPSAPWADRMNSTYRMSRDACELEKYWDRTNEQRFPYFRASGGLYSTVVDYARFLALWMNRGAMGDVILLSQDTVETALEPHGNRGDGRDYGMHWTIRSTDDADGLPAAFGHGGSDGTLAVAFPGVDAMVFFFTQSRGSRSRQRFMEELSLVDPFSGILPGSPRNEEIRKQWAALQKSTTDLSNATDASGAFLDQFTGKYRHGNLEHQIKIQGDSLSLEFATRPQQVQLLRAEDDVFLGRHTCLHLTFRVTFEPDNEGGISGYRFEAADGFEADFTKVQ